MPRALTNHKLCLTSFGLMVSFFGSSHDCLSKYGTLLCLFSRESQGEQLHMCQSYGIMSNHGSSKPPFPFFFLVCPFHPTTLPNPWMIRISLSITIPSGVPPPGHCCFLEFSPLQFFGISPPKKSLALFISCFHLEGKGKGKVLIKLDFGSFRGARKHYTISQQLNHRGHRLHAFNTGIKSLSPWQCKMTSHAHIKSFRSIVALHMHRTSHWLVEFFKKVFPPPFICHISNNKGRHQIYFYVLSHSCSAGTVKEGVDILSWKAQL